MPYAQLPHISLSDPKLNVTIVNNTATQKNFSKRIQCVVYVRDHTRNVVKTRMPNETMQGRPGLHPPVYQLCSLSGPSQSYGPELPHSCQAITRIPSTDPAKEDAPSVASLSVNPLTPPTRLPSSPQVIPSPYLPFSEPSISLKPNTNPIIPFLIYLLYQYPDKNQTLILLLHLRFGH
jgi:hypothetical protein